MSAYAAHRLAAGQEFHEKYGWIAAADVPRYDAGQRNNHGDLDQLGGRRPAHANINSGWHVETEHYLVTTNHSLEAGVQLAQRLERLNEVWRQVFAGLLVDRSGVKEIVRWHRAASTPFGNIRSYTFAIGMNTTRPCCPGSR